MSTVFGIPTLILNFYVSPIGEGQRELTIMKKAIWAYRPILLNSKNSLMLIYDSDIAIVEKGRKLLNGQRINQSLGPYITQQYSQLTVINCTLDVHRGCTRFSCSKWLSNSRLSSCCQNTVFLWMIYTPSESQSPVYFRYFARSIKRYEINP